MRGAILSFVLLLLATAGVAQEFDIFDPNDFLDPRMRGGAFDGTGFRMKENGDEFIIVRAYGGRVTDYQWRNQATDVDLSFLHVTASRYAGNRQWNLKLTGFNPDEGADDLPRYRATGQLGYYFATQDVHGDEKEDEDDERGSGRVLFTYSFETADSSGEGAQRAHEFGIEVDALLHIGRFRETGSLIWMHRSKGAGETGSDRFTYYYRPRNINWGKLQLTAGIGAGLERTSEWHAGALRAVMNASYTLPWGFSVNASYAPAYLPSLEERKTYHELAIYLDRTVASRLTPGRR
jgi:hypothetical protein